MTEEDFYAIAKAKPDVIRLFCSAVNAVIDVRNAAAQLHTGHWAGVHLSEKQAAATRQMTQFTDCVAAAGQPLSEDEKKLLQSLVVRAANFHLLQAERGKAQGEQEKTPETRGADADQTALLGTDVAA